MKQLMLILLIYLAVICALASVLTFWMRRRFPRLHFKATVVILTICGLLFAPIPNEGDFSFLIVRVIQWVRGS